MKLLAEITEKSLGLKSPDEILKRKYRLEKSARAVLLNDKNEISLQLVGKYGYHKFPGGGIEIGETPEKALAREIAEEVGCKVVIEKELGVIIEYRTKHNFLYISYGYLARVKGPIGEPSYEQGEIDDDFKPVWTSLEKAKELLETHEPTPKEHYQGRFIVTRESIFLTEALSLLDA